MRIKFMKCWPYVDHRTDKAFWVKKEKFYNNFDQNDFCCRDTVAVIQGYLNDWFHIEDGKKYFILPTVQIIAGKTQFISGRHRTAVLIDYLGELPFAFARPKRGGMTPILKIVDRPVNLDKFIELPNLAKLDNFK